MLKTRILTAAVLLLVFGVILFIGDKALQLSCAVIIGAIVYEFLSVALLPYRRRGGGFFDDDAIVYSTLLALPGFAYIAFGTFTAFSALVIAVVFFFVKELFRFERAPDEEPAKEIISAFATAITYPLLFGFIFLVSIQQVSAIYMSETWRIILWFVGLVIASDTGAYFGGKAFGKNKLSPRISPNKTVEGAIAGFLSVLVISQALSYLLHISSPIWNQIFVAVLVGVLAPIGDLAESWIKRIYGVKDMSNLLPGHGGVFDRVDSYLFASLALFFLVP